MIINTSVFKGFVRFCASSQRAYPKSFNFLVQSSGRQPRRRRPPEDPPIVAGEDVEERQVRDHLLVTQRRHRRLRPQRELHVHLTEKVNHVANMASGVPTANLAKKGSIPDYYQLQLQ